MPANNIKRKEKREKRKVKTLRHGLYVGQGEKRKVASGNPLHAPALFVSSIFDPRLLLLVLTGLAVYLSDLSHRGVLYLMLLLPFLVGLPLAFFLWMIKTRKVSNWDVTNRSERTIPLLMALGFLVVSVIAVSLLDNPFLLNVSVLYVLWVLGFFVITLFWKISGHSGIAMLFSLLLFHWFGLVSLLSFFIVPIVSWSRVVKKDHTLLQVSGGIVYSTGIYFFWLALFPS